jgi:integrase
VRHYAAQVGHPNFAPRDARRTCARIYYDGKAPLKQIQFLMGHDKLDTTARYVNDEQKFGGEAVSKVADIKLAARALRTASKWVAQRSQPTVVSVYPTELH